MHINRCLPSKVSFSPDSYYIIAGSEDKSVIFLRNSFLYIFSFELFLKINDFKFSFYLYFKIDFKPGFLKKLLLALNREIIIFY